MEAKKRRVYVAEWAFKKAETHGWWKDGPDERHTLAVDMVPVEPRFVVEAFGGDKWWDVVDTHKEKPNFYAAFIGSPTSEADARRYADELNARHERGEL